MPRLLATRRLYDCSRVLGVPPFKIVQDAEARWRSAFASDQRLVQLQPAIQLHERLDNIAPLLSAVDGLILELLVPVLEPFMFAQNLGCAFHRGPPQGRGGCANRAAAASAIRGDAGLFEGKRLHSLSSSRP